MDNETSEFEDDDEIVYLIGVRRPPIPAGESIATGEIIPFPFPTEQRAVIVKDQLIIAIWLTTSEAIVQVSKPASKIDDIIDKVSQVILVSAFLVRREIKKAIRAKIGFAVRAVRVEILTRRIGRITVKADPTLRKVRKLGRRRLRIAKRIQKSKPRVARLQKRAVRTIMLVGRFRSVTKVIGPLIVISTIIDVILIGARTIEGGREAGFAGAVGGFVAGSLDASTLGLAEGVAAELGALTTQLLGGPEAGPTPALAAVVTVRGILR